MNYYNEHDPKAAAWLRELIRAGHIPEGEVDTRDIRDVRATDLVQFTQCHFFAGIGGWSLALRLAGWPDDARVWTGSCPCQPFSTAGKQMGRADARHLWPAFRRLILHGAPPVVFGEQVASAAGREWLAGVRANLETMGYAVGAADLCAAGVGAPHIRQRLFWVADADGGNGGAEGLQRGRRHDEQPEDKAVGGLEHAALDGREQRRAQSGGGSLAGGCGAGRLGFTNGARSEPGQSTAAPVGHGNPLEPTSGAGGVDFTNGRCGSGSGKESEAKKLEGGHRLTEQRSRLGRLADVQQPGLEGYAGHGDDRHEPGRLGTLAAGSIAEGGRAGFWSAYDLIPCADGKARRIEPGTFPLAHGVSGRVGLLRGYGNAIVPQVAAEFIQAYLEAKGETECTSRR